MEIILDLFNERVEEIDLYFNSLKDLYTLNINSEEDKSYYKDEFLKILKANSLIMIYNLVESTVLGGILEIYDRFKEEGLKYSDLNDKIKAIWFSFKFKQVYDKKAHYNSYKDKALEIINCIFEERIIELDRKATNISGNLDAEKIRQVCNEHGIAFTSDNACRGGYVLEDVKEKRNGLAHGTLSFTECGRDYTSSDLIRIKEETVLFLRGLLEGMERYYSQKEYLCS